MRVCVALLAVLGSTACKSGEGTDPAPLADASTFSTTPDAAPDAYVLAPAPDASIQDSEVEDASPDADASRDANAGSDADATLYTDSDDWTMALYDVTGSNHNANERKISARNVSELVLKWRFDAASAGYEPGPFHGTPVVADDIVYAGAALGRFYAFDAKGKVLWKYDTRPPSALMAELSGTPVGVPLDTVHTSIGGAAVLPQRKPYVIFGDIGGNLYALDRRTGEEIWVKENIDGHDLGGIAGNALLLVDDTLVVGLGSLEDQGLTLAKERGYKCCTHRGMVAAFDIATGAEKWRYYTVPPAAQLPAARAPHELGPSGADIWSQPTYDRETNLVFVGTGQNFSPNQDGSGTDQSDAIVALDFTTGTRKWLYQASSGDIWNDGTPTPNANGQWLDADFGDSPKIYTLADGTKVVGAGQKNGSYHLLDARTGKLIKRTEHITMNNSLGGFQTGGAFAEGIVYQHGLDRKGAIDSGDFVGTVMALSADGGTVRWRVDRPLSPIAGGVAVANGVVYFQSPIEDFIPWITAKRWGLFAVDARSGDVLQKLTFEGRAIGSPVVSNGRLYVTDGNFAVAGYGVDETGGISCYGLPD